MARRRHLSRIAVMQALFEKERRKQIDPYVSLRLNLQEQTAADEDFAEELLRGVLENEQELALAIQERAPGWTLERMDPVSRGVLYVGAFELLHVPDVPPAVVINEAIDIAKEYGTDESGKFVNGVLNAFVQKA